MFVVDDHELVRRGLRELLAGEEDLAVVGEAGTVEDALRRIPAATPDVVILDLRLPDGDGIEVCRDVRSDHPEIAVILLTSFGDDEAVYAAIIAGAAAYLLKQIRGIDLVSSIRQVATGRSLLDPAITARILDRIRGSHDRDELAHLSDQERTILGHIAEGLTNRQIGERMFLAEKTVKNYVSNLLSKLGMSRRTEAAAYSARLSARRDGDHRSR